MKLKRQILKNYKFTVRAINSCLTLEQIETSQRLANNFIRMYLSPPWLTAKGNTFYTNELIGLFYEDLVIQLEIKKEQINTRIS